MFCFPPCSSEQAQTADSRVNPNDPGRGNGMAELRAFRFKAKEKEACSGPPPSWGLRAQGALYGPVRGPTAELVIP